TDTLNRARQAATKKAEEAKKVIEFTIDLSAIQTLAVLKLKWCQFEISENSPKGLNLLRMLALMKTKVTKKTLDAIFNNCIHLKTLELINCRMMIDFSRVNVLKEVKLHYNRSYDRHSCNPLAMVIANMGAFMGVHVLAATNIFLESPTNCTLFDIAAFLKKYCPNLEKVSIDINDFTFEPYILWELYQKPTVQNGSYPLNTIKYVEIMGYKNGWHELDIVEFFVRNAKSLEKLKLIEPRNPEVTVFEPEYERITNIKSLSPEKDLIEFIKSDLDLCKVLLDYINVNMLSCS
ncbi:unnamed protein product, partial [Thlaspi arvense]